MFIIIMTITCEYVLISSWLICLLITVFIYLDNIFIFFIFSWVGYLICLVDIIGFVQSMLHYVSCI